MPKSKGRKSKKRLQETFRATIQTPSTRQLLAQILETAWGRILAIYVGFATFATVTGGVFFLFDLYKNTIPTVEVEGSDAASPFAFPFKVSNRSTIFSMRDTMFYCGIDDVQNAEGGGVGKLSVVDSKKTTIAPTDTGDFQCFIGSQGIIFPPHTITSAHIFVRIKYNTLWIRRVSPETEFTWFSGVAAPHWISGKIID